MSSSDPRRPDPPAGTKLETPTGGGAIGNFRGSAIHAILTAVIEAPELRRAWREGGRSKEGQGPTHAPDTAPELACSRRPEPTDRNWSQAPNASDLRQEPGAGKPHAGICAGGRRQLLSLVRCGVSGG